MNRAVNRAVRALGVETFRGARLLHLTTVGRRSGQRRTVPLAFVRDGDDLVVAASNGGADWEPAWWSNLQADPRASLLVVDPDDTSRFIQVRGDVELLRDGAVEHVDALARRYTLHHGYYGGIYPETQRGLETRVMCRIHARRVTLDAIHA